MNKKGFMIAILIILIGGIYFITKDNMKLPGDILSSGNYALTRNVDRKSLIDNYINVHDYNYNSKYKKNQISLKNLQFSFIEEIIFGSDVYLQGLCFTEDYYLITAYSREENILGKMYVFDKETKELLMTFGLDPKSHLGGVVYDGENIWICNSSQMSIERISYAFICNAIQNEKTQMLDIRNEIEMYPVNIIPSCITYHDDKLWIATHTKFSNSQMIAYRFDEGENHLEIESLYTIPPRVQGIVFDNANRVLFSTSYGRKNSSYLKIYHSLETLSNNINSYMESIEMPPCSEGIYFEDGKVFVLFESAGEKYLEGTDGFGKSISPLDKILIIDLAWT